jgi:very-short-patch-repair endonuclease
MASEFARALRNAPTNAEYKLWPLLRKKNVCGVRIRREIPIGPYVADFVCWPAKLVVEIDGDSHLASGAHIRDAVRTRYLRACGFEVLRFWNSDVYDDAEAVADGIGIVIERRMAELGRPMPVRD